MQTQSEDDTTADSHLSYPVASTSKEISPPPPTQPRPLLKDRLYVGNLHPTVDEYTLVQVFSKYGNISKLDFLFHKAGPMKGKHRGYAFIEYATQDDAAKALTMANDKLLRGRKLVVTYAHQAPLDQATFATGRYKRAVSEVGKPTTLSLLKSVAAGRSDGTDDKIAKMEAKLRQLERSSSSGIAHPSLPPKPVASGFPTPSTSGVGIARRNKSYQARNAVPLPSLPLPPQQHPLPPRPSPSITTPAPVHLPPPPIQRKGVPSLVGVKIKKHKES